MTTPVNESMVEIVARAIWDHQTFFFLCSDGKRRDGSWHDCIELARAAIAAMREPTEAMLEAAEKLDGYTVYDQPASAESHYRAMIDAALNGK